MSEVFIILFHNHQHDSNDNRIMKVCLTLKVANEKLKQYKQNDKRSYVEYYILQYDIER